MRGRSTLASLTRRMLLARPDTSRLARRLEALTPKLHNEWQNTLRRKSADLLRIESSLNHLNPDAVLERGYSIVTNAAGRILRDSRSLEPNDRIAVSFHVGRAEATVTSVTRQPIIPNAQTHPIR